MPVSRNTGSRPARRRLQTTPAWPLWQARLLQYRHCFTEPGFRPFAEWLTGLAVNVEEHTVTQSLLALERADDWKALEAFVEYGAWPRERVEDVTARLAVRESGPTWWGYYLWAGDDTKVHRSSPDVWGTCTFHQNSGRCPNRAKTVRTHNWVCAGALIRNDDAPADYRPTAGRLYFRKSQRPGPGSNGEPAPQFRTKNELLVERMRRQARAVGGDMHLTAADGAYAVANVVRPLIRPQGDGPRVDLITRLRHDARLYRRPDAVRPRGRRGRPPRWGAQLPPPRPGGRWPGAWQEGKAFVYGRVRKVRYKEVVCLWRVAGWQSPVQAVVAEVEGYKDRFPPVSTAADLTGLQVVEAFAARFRQEGGLRDQKQVLGWEECRAWTRQPIERTTQALFVVLPLLLLVRSGLEKSGDPGWWYRPPWNPGKGRPSVLDVSRWVRRHEGESRAGLSDWLGNGEKPPGGAARARGG